MDASQLRAMDDAALQKQLDDLQQEMFNLRFQRAAGQLKNMSRFGQVRRDIARVKTVLRARTAAAQAVISTEEAKAQ
jgi:large subunit ribosomal protein L29